MLSSCKFRHWSKGHRQPRDPGMPEFMWGDYLPGDEPGYMCSLEGDYCQNDIKDCPLWTPVGATCLACEAELLTDGETIYCPGCEEEV